MLFNLLKILIGFCFFNQIVFSADVDPCAGMVSLELQRYGYGNLDQPTSCIKKSKTTTALGEAYEYTVSGTKNPVKFSYHPTIRRLDITRGEDPITGDKIVYTYFFSKDSECSMIKEINHNAFRGLMINRKFCEGLDKNPDYSGENKEKLKKICTYYGDRFETALVLGGSAPLGETKKSPSAR